MTHWHKDIDPAALHHAYLLTGNRESLRKEIPEFLEERLRFSTQGNPDYWEGVYELFSIDDARALKEMASARKFGDRRVFVVVFMLMHHEAQNSLLKLMEEPPEATHFFLITERADILLPTLRSRLAHIAVESGIMKGSAQFAEDFLKNAPEKRLELVKAFIEEGNKSETLAFLNALEETLHEKVPFTRENLGIFNDILASRKYLFDRAPSIKMILEHLAVTLPRI